MILMVYDAAARFCREARDAISSGDVKNKGAAIQKAYDAIAEHHGFTLEDHSLVIYGICPSCGESDTS